MPLTRITNDALDSSAFSANTNFDSGTLFVDATNNRVGIGNTSPNQTLKVAGTISASSDISGYRFFLADRSSPYNSISETVSGVMGIWGHNVVANTSNANEVNTVNSGWHSHFMRMYYSDGISFHTSSVTRTAGDLVYSGSGATLASGSAERLRITNGGLVGINTTSPLYQFQVSGAANAGDGPFILGNSANTSYFDQATGAYLHTPGAMVRKDSSTTDMAQAPATFVLYNKNGTDSTGPKLVFAGNETTSTSANPVALAAIAAQKVSGTAGSWATGNMKFLVKATSTYTDVMTLASTGYVTCAGIYNATVGATNRDVYVDNTGLVGYVSSIRASKMNIADITDTAWLLNLNPVSFNYRKKDTEGQYTEEPDGPIEYGLIAEDTEAVKPELCFYDIVDGVPELRGVSYSKLITPLLKLVQQQHELIQTQQAAIGALETRVAALEA